MMPAEIVDTAGQAVRREEEQDRMSQEPRRAERAASWLGWHVPELSGIGLPLAGMAVSPWTATVSALTGAVWAVAEWRQRRRQQANRADTPAVTTGNDDTDYGPAEGAASEGGTHGVA